MSTALSLMHGRRNMDGGPLMRHPIPGIGPSRKRVYDAELGQAQAHRAGEMNGSALEPYTSTLRQTRAYLALVFAQSTVRLLLD